MPVALTETGVVFCRAMRLSLRNPVWVTLGLIQPILYLVLFGPLLKPLVDSRSFPVGSAWQVFVPGLLVQLGIFGTAFVGFGLVAEMRAGVIDRMRVTPASRVALLAGRVLRDVVVLIVQAAILVLVAVAFGMRASLSGVIVGLAVVGLLGASFAGASYTAALVLKSEDALAPLFNGLGLPLLLLSGILLPMTLAPVWLRDLSDVNPVKHIVDGERALFLGQISTATTGWALLAAFCLAAVGIVLGTRSFTRESE